MYAAHEAAARGVGIACDDMICKDTLRREINEIDSEPFVLHGVFPFLYGTYIIPHSAREVNP